MKKGGGLHFKNKFESPPPKAALCHVGPEVLDKKLTVYRRTDRQTDERQQAIRKAHLSFQLR